MPIRGVMFDYGNVLCQPQQPGDIERMAECCGVALERFNTLYWLLREEYDLAELDGPSYWSKIAAQAAVALSSDRIGELIAMDAASWSRPNHVMASWVNVLKAHGVAVAVLSNMPGELRNHISKMSWMPQFDHYTFSCDIRTVKPDHEIYKHCLSGLRLSIEEVLFLDDRSANVEAGRQLGIEGIIFTSEEDLNVQVKSKGLPAVPLPT